MASRSMILGTVRNLRKSWQMKVVELIKMRSFSVSSQAAVDMASKDGELRVFIVAGEVSGDSIASRFMNSLGKLSPFPVRFAGVGGPMMSKQGLNSLFPIEDIAIMGIWELLPHLTTLKVRLEQTVCAALLFRPHIVLTVDAKGFSFRFLKHLRARYRQQRLVSPPHFHFVAPSFWAWKGGEARLKGLSDFIDHVFCILPFEAEICRANGLASTFVGHPILEDISESKRDASGTKLMSQGDCKEFRTQYGIPTGSPVVSLLPGSRLQEVTRMLPIFSKTMHVLKNSCQELIAAVHVAPNQHVENFIYSNVHGWSVPVVLVSGGSLHEKYNSFSASRVALCTSGTVAMELQLARLPCVVAYRAHLLTEWIIRFKAKVEYISLPNILLDSSVIPEALFRECKPSKLAALLVNLMHDKSLREEQIKAGDKVINLLTPSGRAIDSSIMKMGVDSMHLDSTPSGIAAFIVLYSVRT